MSLPAHHLLSAAAFRHIGIMVFFMYYIAAFSLLGFLSVNDITGNWLKGLEHTLDIEIPAYDPEMEYIFNAQQMSQDLQKIVTYLRDDPLVKNLDISQAQNLQTGIENMDIPSPYFITVHLNKERAANTEERLITNMRQRVPHIFVRKPEVWEAEIHRTALTFQIIFGGLTISIVFVTAFIMAAVIRTQLKANYETVKLIHLLGAETRIIASLFKTSITRAVFWGVFLSGGLAAISLTALTVMLGLEDHLKLFYIYLGAAALIFIILCRLITQLTVLTNLREMP